MLTRPALLLLAGLLALPGGASMATDDPPAPEEAPVVDPADAPRRVVIIVNRSHMTGGVVEYEDDGVIVIRTPRDEIESYVTHRVHQVVELVDPGPGHVGSVVMRTGLVHRGIVTSDNYEQVVVEIEGIRTVLPRSTVSHVVLEPTFDERYSRLRAELDPENAGQHLLLCRWLLEKRRFLEARRELEDLWTRHRAPEAADLLRRVEAQIRLEEDERIEPAQDDEPVAVIAPDDDREWPLHARDVNIIRVLEIDFDLPPRVRVGEDTIRALIDRYGDNPRVPVGEAGLQRLLETDPIELVRLLFELRARDLYEGVEVLSEPRSLQLFRRRVHDGWLITHCGSTNCHGAPGAGRFLLQRRHFRDDRTRMANLLVLDRLDLEPGPPLIDWAEPVNSLLIQHALPREEAIHPHPEAPGWRSLPWTSSTRKRMIAGTIEWIESMMREPRPSYPVAFEPPSSGTTSNGKPETPGRQPR